MEAWKEELRELLHGKAEEVILNGEDRVQEIFERELVGGLAEDVGGPGEVHRGLGEAGRIPGNNI